MSSPQSQFLDCRTVDFVIAAKSIFRSPRSQFCHCRKVDFQIAAQSILSSPRSQFLDRRTVNFVIAAKSIFRLPRSQFCHRREVDFFIAAISIFLCLTARIGFIRLTAIHASRRCFQGFALSGSRFACRLALFKTLSSVNVRGCHFPGSKPVDCCLLAVFKLL